MHLLLASLLALFLTGQDGLYEWNKKSTLTVRESVEAPGIVLEPGRYVVKLHEQNLDHITIHILDATERTVLATFPAVQDFRKHFSDEAPFIFYKVEEPGVRAIRSWFYPGDNYGLEFVYPRERARVIAQQSGEHVKG